ncbi:MAG: hypothetical protein RL660_3023 [Bacteroidota bacterium]|jgi:hypothetical protein
MRILFLVAILGFSYSGIYAQTFQKTDTMNTDWKNFVIKKDYWTGTKEVGLNFTGLIHQLVPFNLGAVDVGYTSIRTKWYGKGKYALRTSIGLDAAFFERDPFFYLAVGYEQRRIIGKRLSYTSGWDSFLGNNLAKEVASSSNGATISAGITRHYSLEYNLSSRLYLSTEAQLLVGLGGVGGIRFAYPTSIFFNVRL